MSEQLQLRRGTATQVAAFTGAQGEVVVDTTNNRLVVNDGVDRRRLAGREASPRSLQTAARQSLTPPIQRRRD